MPSDITRTPETPDHVVARSNTFVVFLATELVAVPFCNSGAEAALNGRVSDALIGFGVGLPIGIIGLTFPFWQSRLEPSVQKWIRNDAVRIWVPLALLLCFVYFLGPIVYQRATKMPGSQLPIAGPPRTQEAALRQQITEEQTKLANANAVLSHIPPRQMGPINTINSISAVPGFWSSLLPGTAVLITSDDADNEHIKEIMENILSSGAATAKINEPIKILRAPDYSTDIDAPRIPKGDENGIIIHAPEEAVIPGKNFENILFENILPCFILKYTRTTLTSLAAWYKVPRVLWMEIGKGSPWRPPRGSERWACVD